VRSRFRPTPVSTRWYTRLRVKSYGTEVMPKKKARSIPPKLTEAEQDLLTHMEQGYELETDSLGGSPVLRRLKDGEVIRALSANRHTIGPGGAWLDPLR